MSYQADAVCAPQCRVGGWLWFQHALSLPERVTFYFDRGASFDAVVSALTPEYSRRRIAHAWYRAYHTRHSRRRRGLPYQPLNSCFVARFTIAGRNAISNAACIAAGMELGA